MAKKYFVYIEWGFLDGSHGKDAGKPFEKGIIGYATKEQEDQEFDWIGRAGNEGARFSIFDNLEETILKSHYNPKFIDFTELDQDDLKLKEEILSKYKWDQTFGLIKKSKNEKIFLDLLQKVAKNKTIWRK